MPASIQRYSDPRLYGITLVKPFDKSYQWIRTVAHPLHPECSLVAECAIRAMKMLTGSLALAATALPALIGRAIQIIHYHSISADVRANPPEVVVDGMRLPDLQYCPMPAPKKFHGTSREGSIGILRWGFDPSRTASGSKMAEAVYVSASDVVSVAYGIDQLVLSLDLREGEIAYASNRALGEFTLKTGKDLSDKKVMAAVRELYYQNGYRAIKYDLDHYGTGEAWAVYDKSCISITKIQLSPTAIPIAVQGNCMKRINFLIIRAAKIFASFYNRLIYKSLSIFMQFPCIPCIAVPISHRRQLLGRTISL